MGLVRQVRALIRRPLRLCHVEAAGLGEHGIVWCVCGGEGDEDGRWCGGDGVAKAVRVGDSGTAGRGAPSSELQVEGTPLDTHLRRHVRPGH